MRELLRKLNHILDFLAIFLILGYIVGAALLLWSMLEGK